MRNKPLRVGLIVLGILAIALSVLADAIGLGAELGVFGWKQTLGIVLGLAMVSVGVFLSRQSKTPGEG